ncbi:MAG: sulfite oxidase-like oxidoreductase [Candidatus Hydrothermarchaeaceae archaeon]
MDLIQSPDINKRSRLPPGQHFVKNLPILHLGTTPKVDISSWRFKITGLVEKEKELNFEEFLALPRVRVQSDIHCVTGWSRLNNQWEGVSTSAIKDVVKIKPKAEFVMVYGENGFSTNLSLKDFFSLDVLFALKHEGRDLTLEHGYPVRLVVPRLYFWKSAKWVQRVEFMAEDKPGFWESKGYHGHGDPWKEERYRD